VSPNDKKAILTAKFRQAKENALDAEGLTPILLTKSKIPKLLFYKRKTLLETIFLGMMFWKKWWTLGLPQNLNPNALKFRSVVVN